MKTRAQREHEQAMKMGDMVIELCKSISEIAKAKTRRSEKNEEKKED